jgi:UTP--glucose-1-phosphate uridylyltransferase
VGEPMIGVQSVGRDVINRYGVIKPKNEADLRNDVIEITGIIEKPKPEEAPSDLADFGRMILNQGIVDILKETELGKGNELWIVDAITKYIMKGGRFFAKRVEDGEWLTTGDPLNCMKTSIKYALDREDIGGELREFMREYVL